jgi:hypothetical protein
MTNSEVIEKVKNSYSDMKWLDTPCEYFVREMKKEDRVKKNSDSGFSYINNPCEFIVGFIYGNEFIQFESKKYFSGEGEQGNQGISHHVEGEYFNETLHRCFAKYDSDKITHVVIHESDHQDCHSPMGERYVCSILSFKYNKKTKK